MPGHETCVSSPAALYCAARTVCKGEIGMKALLSPTPEHQSLREMVRQFAEREVAPQALEHDRTETFNIALFRQLGELGLLGITVDEKFGGSGMDATAAVIAHEELSAVDPGFCLAYRLTRCSL